MWRLRGRGLRKSSSQAFHHAGFGRQEAVLHVCPVARSGPAHLLGCSYTACLGNFEFCWPMKTSATRSCRRPRMMSCKLTTGREVWSTLWAMPRSTPRAMPSSTQWLQGGAARQHQTWQQQGHESQFQERQACGEPGF